MLHQRRPQMKVTYVLTHTYSLLGIKSILPMQVLESLATFLPSGQTQIPPSSEDRHSCSHPSDEQRVVAEKKVEKMSKMLLVGYIFSQTYNSFTKGIYEQFVQAIIVRFDGQLEIFSTFFFLWKKKKVIFNHKKLCCSRKKNLLVFTSFFFLSFFFSQNCTFDNFLLLIRKTDAFDEVQRTFHIIFWPQLLILTPTSFMATLLIEDNLFSTK